MENDELADIRAKRMQELQAGGRGQQQNAEDMARQRAEQEMVKNSMLKQLMDQSALARLSNLAAVKPDKAKSIEGMIIQMARTGQIRGKMSDEDLKRLLDQIAEKTAKTTTVKFDRRRAAIDSDED